MKVIFSIALLCILTGPTYTQDLAQYVNPLIGTQKMGHTFPGAVVPFGSVQLSPDTDTIPYETNGKYNKDVYKYCAGYQYEDKTIVGFSHTHFSGTGHSDLGDILIMPTMGQLQLTPGTADKPESGYRSTYSHNTEVASPGYYKVLLEDDNIQAEMTATTRTGIHKYTFNKAGQAHIILDMVHGIYNYPNKNIWTIIRVLDDGTVIGSRQTNGWARTRTVYFALQFSKAYSRYGAKHFEEKEVYGGFWRKFDQVHNFPDQAGKQLRMWFDFDVTAGEAIEVKVALSPVSTTAALSNLYTETRGKDFNTLRKEARRLWNVELNKILIDAREPDKINFYTAMYHSFIAPQVYMDQDRGYKGLDQEVHYASDFTNYTIFSLWDTYRALHPWFNLVQPARNRDMIQSMLAHQQQSAEHMLPVWSHYANENWCMIGYHSVSVIADAYLKGNNNFSAIQALEACAQTARTQYYDGLYYYITEGYIPEDKSGASVSKVLEYAYDDWCIAQLAKALKRADLYREFSERSTYYSNVFDQTSGFMRPRLSDGSFRREFDPLDTEGQGFIEGNSWNYTLSVPQDVPGLMALLGGNKKFETYLDSLFMMHLPDKYFEHTEDITREGIIGNYVRGNEPSHHVAYLYNWTNNPWKTQERVRMILDHQYKPAPDGLGGNDDCGQMSAWYLFSALGFYPVCPGDVNYQLGSPLVNSASINLENGKTLEIIAHDQSPTNVYVKKVRWNGREITGTAISHLQLMEGGKLEFDMTGKKPRKK